MKTSSVKHISASLWKYKEGFPLHVADIHTLHNTLQKEPKYGLSSYTCASRIPTAGLITDHGLHQTSTLLCTGPQLLGNSQSIQPLNWHELCVLRQEPCS